MNEVGCAEVLPNEICSPIWAKRETKPDAVGECERRHTPRYWMLSVLALDDLFFVINDAFTLLFVQVSACVREMSRG